MHLKILENIIRLIINVLNMWYVSHLLVYHLMADWNPTRPMSIVFKTYSDCD